MNKLAKCGAVTPPVAQRLNRAGFLSALGIASCLAFLAVDTSRAQDALTEKLASADLEAGEKVFKKCQACHTVEKDGKNKIGPNLWNVVGGDVAAVEDYKYSKAMMEYGGEWTPERLDTYLTKPRVEVKGTKMTFAGLKKEEDRVNLIAYLNQQGDEPVDFAAK